MSDKTNLLQTLGEKIETEWDKFKWGVIIGRFELSLIVAYSRGTGRNIKNIRGWRIPA
jgi:hypothetical protein